MNLIFSTKRKQNQFLDECTSRVQSNSNRNKQLEERHSIHGMAYFQQLTGSNPKHLCLRISLVELLEVFAQFAQTHWLDLEGGVIFVQLVQKESVRVVTKLDKWRRIL